MKSRIAFAAYISVLVLQANTHAEMQNPPRQIDAYINELKPKAKQLKQQLTEAIKKGQDPTEAIARYTRGMEKLRRDFIEQRTAEYQEVREVRQEAQLAAEVEPVYPGKPRNSDNKYAEYKAPDRMKLDSFEWKQVSSIGNTKKRSQNRDNGRILWLHLNARSRYRPSGKSRIRVQPQTTWEYEDPGEMAGEDWDRVNVVLNQ